MTLTPGSYAGLITVAATSATNGSATVAVNLVVSAGPPTLDPAFPIFPASVIAGPAIDPVITIYGDNFFSTSVVTLQLGANPSITLQSTLLSRKVLQATIKAAYLAAPARSDLSDRLDAGSDESGAAEQPVAGAGDDALSWSPAPPSRALRRS